MSPLGGGVCEETSLGWIGLVFPVSWALDASWYNESMVWPFLLKSPILGWRTNFYPLVFFLPTTDISLI